MQTQQNIIEVKNLHKSYKDNVILDDINIEIKTGSIVGVIGKSGAGKTTLFRCLDLLELPNAGEIKIHGNDILKYNHSQLSKFRKRVGVIFQSFNLLNNRTVGKNVALPLELLGLDKDIIASKVKSILSLVGIANKIDCYPGNLSGGQKQRAAIARALISDVEILLCDEFTSALDAHTTNEILQLLKTINSELGVTIVLVTHDMSVVKEICQYVYVMDHGRIIEEGSIGKIVTSPAHAITKSLFTNN